MILYQCTSPSPLHLSLVTGNDALLFRQDGVYLLLTDINWPTAKIYALQQDISDRQLTCPASVQQLSDTQWVELCQKARQVLLC